MFSHPAFDGHEQVVVASDRESGLRAIIALHSTALGPAFGGCRMWPYATETEAIGDALRLAHGMTHKAAICGLPWGGGKAVIIGDPRRDKSVDLLRAMARVVDRLGGRYVIADDIGTTLDDLAVMREITPHTAAATPAAQQPLAVTAYGVLMAICAALEHRLGRGDLTGLRVAVQGLGNVGFPLCGYLQREGASLLVTDVDPSRVAKAASAFEARAVEADAIYDQEVDVFAPCALGGVLNDATIARLRAGIVCGGANNQLADARHDQALAGRGILYVPDYVANAGGVIDFHQERIDDRPEAVLRAVSRIRHITADVLGRAAASGRTPREEADRVVAERLADAKAAARAALMPEASGIGREERMVAP
jgi:leucine dehydrogenase